MKPSESVDVAVQAIAWFPPPKGSTVRTATGGASLAPTVKVVLGIDVIRGRVVSCATTRKRMWPRTDLQRRIHRGTGGDVSVGRQVINKDFHVADAANNGGRCDNVHAET